MPKKNILRIIYINTFVFLSLLVSIEILSGYYISFNSYKKHKSSIKTLISNYLENKNTSNNRIEEIIKLRKEDKKNIYPSYLYDPRTHLIDDKNYWFSHPSNSEIVFCDEGSGLIKFKTNNIGLREVSLQNLQKEIDLIILGDSYVEGACVNKPFDISSQLAKINNNNVLNLGRSGSGPLFQLGLLREVLAYRDHGKLNFNKQSKLIWVIFTGNDLIDLSYEKPSILKNYLQDNYHINYFKEIELSNIKFDQFFNIVFKNPYKNKRIGRKGDYLDSGSITERNSLIDFGKVFEKIVNLSRKENFELNIVLLTNHKHKSKDLMQKTEDKVNSLCNRFEINCKKIDLKKINKSKRGHLDEDGYKNLSQIISRFIYKN